MMMNSIRKSMLVAGMAVMGLMAACGGGGGNAGTPPFAPPDSGNPVAADLIMTVDKAQIANTGADKVSVTVTAVDSNRQTIANVPISVRADNGAVVTATATASDGGGQLTGSLSIGDSKANRIITVTALSGTVSKTLTVAVTGAKLVSSGASSIADNTPATASFRLTDNNDTSIPGQVVSIVANGLLPASATGVTDTNGEYVFSYKAPTGASGSFPITATAGGRTATHAVQITGTVTVPDVTDTIVSASVSANPSVVSVNQVGAATQNRTEIRAVFLGANNKAIPNVRVKFDLDGDQLSVGGAVTSGIDTVLSNISGIATTSYVPGARSSPLQGVTVRACYAASDAGLTGCPNSVKTTLTVSAEPLGVSIGTNAEIKIGAEGLTYIKEYVVTVVDASGNPMSGVDVAAFIALEQYRKGYYDYYTANTTTNQTAGWRPTVLWTCKKEDQNDNGSIDDGDDIDRDGRLDPRPSDVSVKMLQSKTNTSGIAVLQIEYAQSFATWINAKITVSATGVGGTEGRDSYLVVPLPAVSTAFTSATVSPAFWRSPYGVVADCEDKN